MEIEPIFGHTRRDDSVSKEVYYTLLGVKEDGSHEVLAIVNHPMERALLWEHELKSLRERGVESVGLFVSDALVGIEDAVKGVSPNSKHRFCGVLKRNILSVFSHKDKKRVGEELNEVFPLETKFVTPIEGVQIFMSFCGQMGC